MKITVLKGDLFVLMASALWSFFPLLSVQVIHTISPLMITGIANLFAACFLMIMISIKGEWKNLYHKKGFRDVLLTVAFISVLGYFLLFSATQFTSSNNVAILGLSQILWGFVILGLLKIEHFTFQALEGSLIMIVGAACILYGGTFDFNPGDWLVLGANACFVTGNIFQRRARSVLSSTQLLFLRSLMAGLFCFFLATMKSGINPIQSLSSSQWGILITLGVVIFSLEKICWIEGIHRIPITRANVIGAIHPGFTMLWGFLFLADIPTLYQWLGFFLMIVGSWFILVKKDIFKVLKA